MLNPTSLDAIVELLSVFLMPTFFFFLNHFTLLDPWKYFAFAGTNDLLDFARIEGVLSFAFLEPKDLPSFISWCQGSCPFY